LLTLRALRPSLSGLLLAALAAGGLGAQEQSAPAVRPVAAPAGGATIPAATVPGAPRPVPVMRAGSKNGDVRIDGLIDEPAWEGATLATNFVESEPNEGMPAPPELTTEARVMFDREAIYVAMRMFDPEPEKIGRQLVRRDDRGPFFDWVSVSFDPNFDRRTGYVFRVNAAGVQGDAYLTDDSQEDIEWDAVFESAVHVDSLGWIAEFRIPLNQIRYPSVVGEAPRTWGINFTRRRVASAEMSHFALFVRQRQNEEGNVSRFGTIENVVVPSAVRRMAARPYVLSSFRHAPTEDGNPFFDGNSGSARFGSDFRLGLGSAFTLDGTVNPDFGQVEADPADINLTAFETFFNEQRPFFVEDAQIFDFRLGGGGGGGGGMGGGRGGGNQLFYSRRIGRAPHADGPDEADFTDIPSATSILGAAKLTGRSGGGMSIGMLSAVTQTETGRAFFTQTGEQVEFDAEPLTEYGVLSAQQDLNGGASQIGAIATALRRELPGDGVFDFLPSEAFNAGLRFDHQWNQRAWRLNGYMAASHVRGDPESMIAIQRASNHYFQRPDATRARVDSAATGLTGAEWRIQIDRQNARHWIGSAWLGQATKAFEVNDLGFSSSRERVETGVRVGYREIRPGRLFRDYNVNLNTSANFSHEAFDEPGSWTSWRESLTGGSLGLNMRATLLAFHMLNADLNWQPDQYSRTLTRGGPVMIQPGMQGFRLGFNSDRRGSFGLNFNLNMNRAAHGAGGETSVNATVNLRPTERTLLDIQPRLTRQTDGTQYVTNTTTDAYAPTFGRRYLFGELERTTISVQTRVNYIFTPTLSLQVYLEPLLSSGDYTAYKQLERPSSYAFRRFTEGSMATGVCSGGSICRDAAGNQRVDFNGDGVTDFTFEDEDFNVRSLIGNAVIRWEYRPGSTVFLVWQRAQQGEAALGDFDFSRDARALFDVPADNRFILKVNYWLGL
jgi:hypothetical protein